MNKIKLYYDTLSQPSRAVKIFLLVNKIPYEGVVVNLRTGEHFQPEYEKINPFKKVPVVEHNDFVLTESIAIFRYLCRELDVADHWYPRDSKLQARVDEYLEWQHLNTRLFCGLYTQHKLFKPLITGKPADEKMVNFFYKKMQTLLDEFSNIWLKDRKYLCGNTITIADIVGVTELEQPRLAGYDVGKDRPVIKAYMERVRGDLQPHYDKVMTRFHKILSKNVDQQNMKSKM